MKKSTIRRQLKILLAGCVWVLHGAATVGLVYFAAVGFVSVAKAGGYKAVGVFILAAATLAVAVWNMYAHGKEMMPKKKRFNA